MYGNVSRWVFSGGRERGRPDVDYGYGGVGGYMDDNALHDSQSFRQGPKFFPTDGIYIPPPTKVLSSPYAYNAPPSEQGQGHRRLSKKSSIAASYESYRSQHKKKGQVQTGEKYESLDMNAHHHHEYLEGHNFSENSSRRQKEHSKKGGKKHPSSKSNKSIQLFRRGSKKSESNKSEPLQDYFTNPHRKTSYPNYMMESNIKNIAESKGVIESSLVSRSSSRTSDAIREKMRKEELRLEEAEDTGDDIQDSTFCSDFDESVKDYQLADANQDDYENEGIIKKLLREMQGSGRLRHLNNRQSTSYENEVSQKQQMGSYENEEIVRKMPPVLEDRGHHQRESYENEASNTMVPGAYENEEILNKMPSEKQEETALYIPDIPYENEFSPSQQLGSYENEEVVRKMPYNHYEDDHGERQSYKKEFLRQRLSDATSLGSITQILKQFDFIDGFDGISTKAASVDENIYSCLDDHQTQQNKIYNASINTYLEPTRSSPSASNFQTQHGSLEMTPTPIPPPRHSKRLSSTCQSLSSLNSPIYENFPSGSSYPSKGTQIITSNLSLSTDNIFGTQNPDELFYAVAPAIRSPDTPAVGSPDVFLQSPSPAVQMPFAFPFLTNNTSFPPVTNNMSYFASVSANMPSAPQVFMKEEFEHQLDIEAKKLHTRGVLVIQKVVRMYLARRKFKLMQKKTIKLQAAIRMRLAR